MIVMHTVFGQEGIEKEKTHVMRNTGRRPGLKAVEDHQKIPMCTRVVFVHLIGRGMEKDWREMPAGEGVRWYLLTPICSNRLHVLTASVPLVSTNEMPVSLMTCAHGYFLARLCER